MPEALAVTLGLGGNQKTTFLRCQYCGPGNRTHGPNQRWRSFLSMGCSYDPALPRPRGLWWGRW